MAFRSFIVGLLWAASWPAAAGVGGAHGMAAYLDRADTAGSAGRGFLCCHPATGPACRSASLHDSAALPIQRQPEPDEKPKVATLSVAPVPFPCVPQARSVMLPTAREFAAPRAIYLTTLRFRL